MPRVKGKKQLCSSEQKYFKSVQGTNGHTLFDRYSNIENVVNTRIGEKYRHFLAEPIEEDNKVIWFSSPYNESPERLSELKGEEHLKYNRVKQETLSHYSDVIRSLRNENKNPEAETLERAIKFINDDFVYCYDDKTVLGIWGMEIRENYRESSGIVMKDLFVKKPRVIHAPDEPIVIPFTIRFNAGEHGNLDGVSELLKNPNETISESEFPKIETIGDYEFIGWDKEINDSNVSGDTEFTAQYRQIVPPAPPPAPLPWYKRLGNWLRNLFFDRGCLKWLLWLLLILLFLLILSWLFRSCQDNTPVHQIPDPINDKPWVQDDPRAGYDGGIYDPGNPYTSVPTPPDFSDVLPPLQGMLPPIDTTKIIHQPGSPVIISNRLNILMENDDKSILDLAKEFKVKYPDEDYLVIYYDDVVKRMQIEFPSEERLKLKSEIPGKFAPEYDLFVFDESLFEAGYSPNDPALSDPNKAWYLKTINASKAWDVTRGSPELTIAIVDNGFSLKHPELKSKVVMPYNVWLHSKEVFSQPLDHGTHVAGTALAIANNGKGLCGIAPECAFMPIQVANNQGLMTTTSVLDGILYALYQGADIINVSLGMEFTGTLPKSEQRNLQDHHFKEEERLWNKVMEISNKHKAIIIVAAGNENMLAGVNPMSRPKNFIVVSAVDKSNNEYRKTGFSNYGDYSTISAPGVDIFSTVGDNNYQVMDGTSMAAPIVSGAVALMKSLNADLTSEQISCILQGTGKPAEGAVGNLIQLDKALQKVQSGEFTDCDSRPEIPSTGDVQILLSWDNYNDLDLVCFDPSNEPIWFKNKRVASGGKLEIDMNVDYPDSKSPIENIYWPSDAAPNGTYKVYLTYYKKHIDINDTPYTITVKYGNKKEIFTGKMKIEGQTKPIFSFTMGTGENLNALSTEMNLQTLLLEREQLKGKIDQVNSEIQDIRNK